MTDSGLRHRGYHDVTNPSVCEDGKMFLKTIQDGNGNDLYSIMIHKEPVGTDGLLKGASYSGMMFLCKKSSSNKLIHLSFCPTFEISEIEETAKLLYETGGFAPMGVGFMNGVFHNLK